MKKLLIILVPGILTFFISTIEMRAQYGSTVSEGRKWNYSERIRHANEIVTRYEIAYGYHFEGTITINDKIYAIFRDGDNKPLALMRQEGSRVYTYIQNTDPDLCRPISIPDLNGEGNPFEGEFMLYDFCLKEGDTFQSIGFDNVGSDTACIVDLIVLRTYTEYSCGAEYRVQEITYNDGCEYRNGFKLLEGIGYIEDGRLPFPMMGTMASSGPVGEYYTVYTVEDNGRTIYESPAVGITNIYSEENAVQNQSDEIFDLTGQPVKYPTEGSIYIINHKKVIWE